MRIKATLPLEDLRVHLKDRVNVMRADRLYAGYEFDGHRYDSDQAAILNITAVVSAVAAGIKLPDGFSWRTADNETVPHTAESITRLAAELLAYIEQCYAASWALKDAIDATKNPSSVDLFSAWPIRHERA